MPALLCKKIEQYDLTFGQCLFVEKYLKKLLLYKIWVSSTCLPVKGMHNSLSRREACLDFQIRMWNVNSLRGNGGLVCEDLRNMVDEHCLQDMKYSVHDSMILRMERSYEMFCLMLVY